MILECFHVDIVESRTITQIEAYLVDFRSKHAISILLQMAAAQRKRENVSRFGGSLSYRQQRTEDREQLASRKDYVESGRSVQLLDLGAE